MAAEWDEETKVQQAVAVPAASDGKKHGKQSEPAQKRKVCFCIMPVTVPVERISYYSGGADHFRRVFDCLFEPAVKGLGEEWSATFPSFDGSGILPTSIVEAIRTADLCLADVSCLKPNVYLEIGIRLALDKPLALVRDETVEVLPFDCASLGHGGYMSHLGCFDIDKTREHLTSHLERTLDRYGKGDTFWASYGGVTKAVRGVSEEVAVVLERLEAGLRGLTERTGALEGYRSIPASHAFAHARFDSVTSILEGLDGKMVTDYERAERAVREASDASIFRKAFPKGPAKKD